MATYKFYGLNRLVCRSRLILRQQQQQIVPSSVRCCASAAPTKKSPNSTLRLLLIGMGVGGVVGSGYSGYVSYTKSRLFSDIGMQTEAQPPHVIDRLPDVKITRKVVNPKDESNLDLVLFQFQTCPFCCKVTTIRIYI